MQLNNNGSSTELSTLAPQIILSPLLKAMVGTLKNHQSDHFFNYYGPSHNLHFDATAFVSAVFKQIGTKNDSKPIYNIIKDIQLLPEDSKLRISTLFDKESEAKTAQTEPYWLSDYRDPSPRITTEWPKEDRKQSLNWSYSCSSVDYNDAIYHSDLELCLWGVWSEVHNYDQAKDIRIRSSLVNPKTSEALWRSLQSAESSYSYHLPSANNEQFEIDEDNFKLKGWITETEIDLSNFDDDLWGASLRYEMTQPSKEIIALMNLSSDSLGKNWFHENEKVMNLKIWGQYKNEHYEYSNGYKLKVDRKFILELLEKLDMDMIISVDIDRRYKYGSYQSKQDSKRLDEYLPSSKRIYLMKKNGDMYVY